MKVIIEQVRNCKKFGDKRKAEIIEKLKRIALNDEANCVHTANKLIYAFAFSETLEGYHYWITVLNSLPKEYQ